MSAKSSKKTPEPRTSSVPDGSAWMAPYYRAMDAGINLEGHTQRHVALPNGLTSGLRSLIEAKEKQISKIRAELEGINQANRTGSTFRGLQRNGSNGWAVLVAKESQGNKGRKYIGTYLDEKIAAIKWDQGMLELNGLSMVWKLNLPNHPSTLDLINDLQAKAVGSTLDWGGKDYEGEQYIFTKYFGVFELNMDKNAYALKNTKTPFTSVEGVDDEDYIPGRVPRFACIARIAGKTCLVGRYTSQEEAAAAYDEVATVAGLPVNNITYKQIKAAREQQFANAAAAFKSEIIKRDIKLSKRGRKAATGKHKQVKINAEGLRELKAKARSTKKKDKEIATMKARNAKLKERLKKASTPKKRKTPSKKSAKKAGQPAAKKAKKAVHEV